jgi:lysophospholipase L1-like esterase
VSDTNTVQAFVSTGTGTTEITVNIGTLAASGTLVQTSPEGTIGASPLVLYNWNPATQLTNFLAAEAQVAAGDAGARVKIVALGDSTTAGYKGAPTDYRNSVSYPEELALSLSYDGIPAQSDNFLGEFNGEDGRIALVGTAALAYPEFAGGQVIRTAAVGDGVNFTLNTPQVYDRVDISYVDHGNGSLTVAVDGGPVLATLQLGNTGQIVTKTIDIPSGLHAVLNIRSTSSTLTSIEGAAFWNSANPSVEVYNAGVPGAESSVVGNGSTAGVGEIPGVVNLNPNLALIDYGINDINNGDLTIAQTVANISAMITALRSVNCDVIIIIPQPFSSPAYATQLPALRAALEALSDADNVPIIDLSATYGDSFAALAAAGLMSDLLHPDATLYADIGSKIAALLAQTIDSAAACFAAGTRILTPHGEQAVEDLAAGDVVMTHTGAAEVIWLGRRRINLARHRQKEEVQPIRIAAGALCDGFPRRDLLLSPDHALYLDGHLIPAKALLNGFTIRRSAQPSVTYYHIEVSRHAAVFAEGVAAETYLETGNRGAFENTGAIALHPAAAQALREETGFAPFAEAGPVVEAVRQRILDRAEIETDGDPDTSILYSNGSAVIASRSAVPGEIFADPRDRRRLGVKLAGLSIGGAVIPLDHPLLTEGWHEPEPDGRWTDGYATIPASLVNGGVVNFTTAATLAYPTTTRHHADVQIPRRAAGR